MDTPDYEEDQLILKMQAADQIADAKLTPEQIKEQAKQEQIYEQALLKQWENEHHCDNHCPCEVEIQDDDEI